MWVELKPLDRQEPSTCRVLDTQRARRQVYGAIAIAELGGLFRGPGEEKLNPQTWVLI